MRSTSLHIPSLDGIRAVSIMLVFIAHSGLGNLIPGGLGVTIFFFLSGYLITTLLRLEADSNGRIDLGAFYVRRMLRIWPPFYVMLLLAILLHVTGVFSDRLNLTACLFQACHISNYWTIFHSIEGIPRGTNVFWSLAVEEHFYLVFPLLYILLRKWCSVSGQTLCLLAICLAILVWRIVLIQVYGYSTITEQAVRTGCGTDTRADSILWGCLLAIAWNPVLDQPFARGPKLAVWVLIAAATMLFTLVYRNGVFRETARYTLHSMALIPIFTAAILWSDTALFRWLSWEPMRKLGVWSYSLYLSHYTLLYLVWERLPLESVITNPLLCKAVQAVLAFGLSIGFAILCHQFIERPCARWRARFGVNRDRSAAPPSPEPRTTSSATNPGFLPAVEALSPAGFDAPAVP